MRTKIFKIFQTIFVFGFIIWLGGTVLRTILAYNLFQVGISMELNPNYTNIERMNTIYLFSTTSLITGICYCLAVLSSVFIAIMYKGSFKKQGWIFMSFVLFVIAIPIQTYFLYLDYCLADAVYFRGILDFYHPDIQKYFVERFKDTVNASMRALLLLSSFTCILYMIWRPLDKSNKNIDN